MSLTFYVWSNSPTRISFFLLKQLTFPQRAKQSLDKMVSGVTKISPLMIRVAKQEVIQNDYD